MFALLEYCAAAQRSRRKALCALLLRRYASLYYAQEEIGFDALLLCNDADLAGLGLRKGVRVKILGAMRGWAADELARLSGRRAGAAGAARGS